MTAFPPLAVANSVLGEAWSQKKPVTIMQLLKLVYISHGWSLGLLDQPLVDEEPEAWQHGPVFPSVYRAFRGAGSQPITELGKGPYGSVPVAALAPPQQDIVRSVVKNYGDMHAFGLSRITHSPDTPWSRIYKDGSGSSDDIPDALIREHYKKLAIERRPTS